MTDFKATPAAAQTLPRGASASARTLGGTLGRYTIVGQLGQGAMGTVLAAQDLMLNRRVALKLLRAHDADVEARARLVREAQALAAITHPNVVTVYEVGEVEGQWFLAMALVEGGTLLTWQAARPRTWRQIVDAYVQAARGLAAAHRAGLVHRDFKPSNALMGADGVVRVSDFGLVRAVAVEDLPASGGEAAPASLAMTRAGTVLGTPAYMAPEQHLGEVADARSDQFSFGCALYEALYGQVPFQGEGYQERAAHCLEGVPLPEPAASKVPGRIRAVVRRALSRNREDRFAGMDDLIAALTRPRLSRRVRFALGAALCATVVAGGVLATRAANRSCQGLDAPFLAAWSQEVEGGVRAAFDRTGLSFAKATADRVALTLGGYREKWTSSRVATCQASQRGELSAPRFEARMRCLDRCLDAARTLVGELRAPDAKTVARAATAAERLPAVADCSDDLLAVAAPLPTDPATRARIFAEERRLTQAQAEYDLGRYGAAVALAAEVVTAAQPLAYAPLTARAQQLVGRTAYRVGELERSLTALDAAASTAASAHDDALLADVLSNRFYVTGDQAGKLGEALGMQRFIELLLQRAGQPRAVRALWLNNLGVINMVAGHLDEARAAHEEALAIREKDFGADHSLVVQSLDGLGNVLNRQGHFDEAERLLRRAMATQERRLGPDHPDVASLAQNLGATLASRGDMEQALGYLQRSYEIQRAASGPQSPDLWIPLSNSAHVLLELGRIRAAREKLTMALESLPPEARESPQVGMVEVLVGIASLHLGERRAAAEHFERSVKLSALSGVPTESEIVARARLAALSAAEGAGAAARRHLEEALAVNTRAPAAEQAGAASSLALAQAQVARLTAGCAAALPRYVDAAGTGAAPGGMVQMEASLGAGECLLSLGRATEAHARLKALVGRLGSADDRFAAPARAALARAEGGAVR